MKRLIVAMGDSTTAGTPGWKSAIEAPPFGEGDQTSQYAWWLMQDEPGWQVLNHGVNGQRSDEIRERFERDVIDHQPSVTVIIAGVNDVYQGRDAAHVIAQLSEMYRLADEANINVVAGTIVPYNTATEDQNRRMQVINEWIRARATGDPRVTFVDTRTAVAAPDDPNRLFESPDDLHPSPAGYLRMADVIRAAIKRLR